MHQDRPGAWPQASAGASGGLWRAAGGATARRAAKRASLVIGACGRHGATAWALLLRKLRGCGATAAGPGPPEQLLSVWAGADRGTDRGSAAGAGTGAGSAPPSHAAHPPPCSGRPMGLCAPPNSLGPPIHAATPPPDPSKIKLRPLPPPPPLPGRSCLRCSPCTLMDIAAYTAASTSHRAAGHRTGSSSPRSWAPPRSCRR